MALRFSKKQLKKTLSAIGRVVLTIGLIGIITGCIIACVLTVYIATNFSAESNLPDVETINQNQTSIVMTMDSKTGEYKEFTRLQGVNRLWVPYDDIPQNMFNAVVAIEDERFWEHYGVDWKRTVLAFANLVVHFNSNEFGGSTLTQQLIKNLSGDDDHTAQRKVREILTAIELEKIYSKEEILQAYLNILPLSNDIQGVGYGANYYFGVDAKDLTLAQCAAIAAITQSPARYNPYNHPKALIARQQTVLMKMHELGFITTDEYRQALGEELYFHSSTNRTAVYDYYTDMLIDDVSEALCKQYGYTDAQAKNMVFYGGLTIYSCEDPVLQKKAEAIYANDENFPAKLLSDSVDPQAAIYVMDYTGRCVTVVGGRGEKSANRILNRAVSSLRQPGSSMKPLTVYTPALHRNLINFSSPVPNCYILLKDGTKWPRNYNQSRPANLGMTVVDVAVQSSLNTAAAQIMQQLTPQSAFSFATGSLNLSSLVTADSKGHTDIDFAPMTLGGLTQGVYPREIAAAYQIFGNGGYYNEPYSFTKVTRGNEVLLTKSPSSIPVVDENTAYIMNRLMQHVITGKKGATAGALRATWSKWEVFGKTGTTQTNNDVWLVAGTPKYVAASWFGYDKNQELTNKQTSAARNLWNKVMVALHEGETPCGFERKGTTVEAKFCYQTGLLATSGCKDVGVGVYKPDHLPGVCTEHEGTPLNEVEGTDIPLFGGQFVAPDAATTTAGTTTTAAH